MWRVVANLLNKQSWAGDKRWSSRLGLAVEGAIVPHRKEQTCYEMLHRASWIGLDSSGSVQGPVEGSCEYGDELPGSIKGGEFLD
jgi:hypothetical protein